MIDKIRKTVIYAAIACSLAFLPLRATAQEPLIEGIVPNEGYPGDQDLEIRIIGMNFRFDAEVIFGDGSSGIHVDGPVVLMNEATLELVIDIDSTATPGAASVTVVNPDGSEAFLPNAFIVLERPVEAPEILSVDPARGLQGEMGLLVTIYGRHLDSVETVDFEDGITATILDQTDDMIEVLLDIDLIAAAGLRDVRVSGPAGDSESAGAFEVTAPVAPAAMIPGGELQWVPDSLVLQGFGTVSAIAVISVEAAASLPADSSLQIWISDDAGDFARADLLLSDVQFSIWNPLPQFGPAAMLFEIDLASTGPVADGMDAGDLAIQLSHAGEMLCDLNLSPDSSGDLSVGIDIGGVSVLLPVAISWPWENECWEVWVEWWQMKGDVDDECGEERNALREAQARADKAHIAFEAARATWTEAVDRFTDASLALLTAQCAVRTAERQCKDFFSECVASGLVSPNHPFDLEREWQYMEVFGGAIGMWYVGEEGAALLNDCIDADRDRYDELGRNLRDAHDALEEADRELDEASEAANEATTASEAARAGMEAADEALQAAQRALDECLENTTCLADGMQTLETSNPECFN